MQLRNIDEMILPIAKFENGCDHHRITEPFRQLGISNDLRDSWRSAQDQYLKARLQQRATGIMKPYNICFSHLHILGDQNLDPALADRIEAYIKQLKAITFSRDAGLPFDKLLQLRSDYGIRIIVDFDDYWVLNKDHVLIDMWKQGELDRQFERVLREADAVTTTTQRLAEKIENVNPRVFVVPNAMPLMRKVQDVDWNIPIKFGYIAGVTHLNDLETIGSVFRRVKDLDFTLFGYDNPAREKMIAERANNGGRFVPLANGLTWDMAFNEWDEMVELCSNHGRNPKFKTSTTRTLDTYMQHYDQIHVAIAPLADNEFNAHKSSLKAYEAAAKGCAMICSKVPPFTDDLPTDVVTFCATPGEWIEAIERHKDPAYARQQAQKLQDWFLNNRSYEVVNKIRLEAYDRILTLEPKV